MSDRLQELLRQKALLTEHATWLEGEISAERLRTATQPAPAAAPKLATPLPEPQPQPLAQPISEPAPSSPVPDENVNAIFEQYRSSPRSLQHEVRFGCFLYFFGALVLLGLGVGLIYLTHRGK